MAKKKSTEGGPSKMDAVRQALAELGHDAPAKEIQAFVKEHFGFEMPKNHVSACKTKIGQETAKKPRPVMQPAAASSSVAPPKKATISGAVLMEDVLQVKDLVGRVGTEDLRILIEAFAR